MHDAKKFVSWPGQANVVVFGARLGREAAASLQSLRQVSWFVEGYDADKKMDLLANINFSDDGDLEFASYDDLRKITDNAKKILEAKKIPLMLGGGHLAALYALQALGKDVKILTLDAHCDLKDSYIDEKIVDLSFIADGVEIDPKLDDATYLRRACEDSVDPKNVMMLGIRSCDEDEINFAEKNKIQIFTAKQIKNNMAAVKQKISEFTRGSDVYINLDLDVFDPCIAPAVDQQEPCGIDYFDYSEIIDSIGEAGGKLVGMNVACLRSLKDENNKLTEFLATKCIFDAMSLVKSEKIKE